MHPITVRYSEKGWPMGRARRNLGWMEMDWIAYLFYCDWYSKTRTKASPQQFTSMIKEEAKEKDKTFELVKLRVKQMPLVVLVAIWL